MKIEGQTMEVHATASGLDSPVRVKVGIVTGASRDRTAVHFELVPAVLREVKERAVVDKPITEAEVVAQLEASH